MLFTIECRCRLLREQVLLLCCCWGGSSRSLAVAGSRPGLEKNEARPNRSPCAREVGWLARGGAEGAETKTSHNSGAAEGGKVGPVRRYGRVLGCCIQFTRLEDRDGTGFHESMRERPRRPRKSAPTWLPFHLAPQRPEASF